MLFDFDKDKYNFTLTAANAFLWETDIELKTIKLSESFENFLGFTLSDVNGSFKKYLDLTVSLENVNFIYEKFDSYIKGKSDIIHFEITVYNLKGEEIWLQTKGSFYNGDKKKICGISIDISEHKTQEKTLVELAYKDSLTGLYNMQYLTDGQYKLSDINTERIGILVLDIRSFRNINEAFGHEFGDIVLICFTEKLKKLVEDNTIIRVSGDEFLIIFEKEANAEFILSKARNITASFDKPILIREQMIYLNLNIGIAVSKLIENSNIDIISLFKDAEIALYYAKRNEIENICLLNDFMRNELDSKVSMEFDLKNATRQKEFVLYFQPKVDAKTKKVIGSEALIRWNHPQFGIVPPMSFIPLAEESGLIISIGEYVIAETARQLSIWRNKGFDIFVSINVSAKQFLSPDFVDCVYKWIMRYALPPGSLVIEITESVFISDFERICDILQQLRANGIRVSLDDFGTGYSSLSYLGKMPLDNLKIDRTFLVNALGNKNDLSILKAIIVLAHNMNLFVTAEGVENLEQLKLLEEYGCDVYQGYYFSKPLPADKFIEFLGENENGFKNIR